MSSLIVMALLFIFEALSVILQVIYYKKTKGKRLFKMAPFHHHLEKSGFKEIQVDLLFYLIQIILVILVIIFKHFSSYTFNFFKLTFFRYKWYDVICI